MTGPIFSTVRSDMLVIMTRWGDKCLVNMTAVFVMSIMRCVLVFICEWFKLECRAMETMKCGDQGA